MAEDRKKIGLALHPAFVRELNAVADKMKPGGLKARCLEAALLMFLEADEGRRVEYVSRVQTAELTGNVDDLVAVAARPKPRIAANFRRPTKS